MANFDDRSTLDIIRSLNFVRVCGSEGERWGMDVITQLLDKIGIIWHYHTFYDKWLVPDSPHLLVGGKRISVRPAVELSYHSGIDFVNNDGVCVNVRTELSAVDGCSGKIAVVEQFIQEKPIVCDAAAQLIAFEFTPEMEPYLWAHWQDVKRVPAAVLMPEDVPFVLDTLGEPAELKWSVKTIEREFRNLVAEIPGKDIPDEIIVIGAHMDSWPGTVGASDDAAGCAVLIEATKWFVKHQPLRTVRLIWFTGEEVDARGSRRYVSECVPDPQAIKLMVNVDSGCEIDTGPFNVYASDESTIEWARRHMNLGDMEHIIIKAKGLDAGAFIEAGIPALGVEAPFRHDYHNPDDNPESIDPGKLQILGSLSLDAAIHAACECSI